MNRTQLRASPLIETSTDAGKFDSSYPASNRCNVLRSEWIFTQKASIFLWKKAFPSIFSFKPDKKRSDRAHWSVVGRWRPISKISTEQCRVTCRGQRSVLWQLIGTWQYIGHDCLTGTYIIIFFFFHQKIFALIFFGCFSFLGHWHRVFLFDFCLWDWLADGIGCPWLLLNKKIQLQRGLNRRILRQYEHKLKNHSVMA